MYGYGIQTNSDCDPNKDERKQHYEKFKNVPDIAAE